jgi:hypothetical protein
VTYGRARGGEQGASLIIALAVLAALGLFVAVMLSNGETSLKVTSVVRTRDDLQATADASIDYAIQYLRVNPAICSDVSSSPTSITVPVLNGAKVTSLTVTCQAVAGSDGHGSSGGTGRYAVVTTDTVTGSLLQTGGSKNSMTITGEGNGTESPHAKAVYVAAAPTIQHGLTVGGGDFLEGTSNCSGVSKPAHLTMAGSYGWSCVPQSIPDPFYELPASPPAIVNPSPVIVNANCTLFNPGTYNAPPSFNAVGNYFASGVYYFLDTGTMTVPSSARVDGGKPKSPETQALNAGPPVVSPCASDATPGALGSGNGVLFIFGGSSALSIGNKATFELYSRVPSGATAGSEGDPGLSIYTVRSTFGGWKCSGYPSCTAGGLPVPAFANVSQSQVVIHGIVYAYNANVVMFVTNSSVASLAGGIIVNDLTLDNSSASCSTGCNGVSVPSGTFVAPTRRIVEIVADAKGGGQADIIDQAVVRIANDASYSTTILSWRKCGSSSVPCAT